MDMMNVKSTKTDGMTGVYKRNEQLSLSPRHFSAHSFNSGPPSVLIVDTVVKKWCLMNMKMAVSI